MSIRNVFILSEVRTGSTYAAELISYAFKQRFDLDLWGLTKEAFQQIGSGCTADDLCAALGAIWMTPEGLRPAMIKCGQLSAINAILADATDLRDAFYGPEAYWIVIRRRDKIGQASSLTCAMCSGSYHHYADAQPCEPCVRSHPDVLEALRMVIASDVFLDLVEPRLSNRIAWTYEDIVAAEPRFLEDCARFILAETVTFAPDCGGSVKLVPAHRPEKEELQADFRDWLLRHYHAAASLGQ